MCEHNIAPFFARKPCGLPQVGMTFLASQGSAKMPRGLPRGASLLRSLRSLRFHAMGRCPSLALRSALA